jgi:hypothetical protein
MPNDASARGEPARLTERVRLALESGDLNAIRDLIDPDARWGAPEGPHAADCKNRDQVVAWWASARAAGALPGYRQAVLQSVATAVSARQATSGRRVSSGSPW